MNATGREDHRPGGQSERLKKQVVTWLEHVLARDEKRAQKGVVGGAPGSYVLSIAGEVDPAPPYTCQWDLELAAGLLTNATSPTPTHTEPNAAGEGVLKLTGMNGATVGACEARKQIKIYPDHLARDYDNFGVGISCGPNGSGAWRFTHLGATIDMPGPWNCHGGTQHIYDGRGSGNTGPGGVNFLLGPSRLRNTVQVTHTPTGNGTHPALGPLNRGDIVAYFTAAGDLAHTQTCTGNGTETYGANNVPVRFPGRPRVDETWQYDFLHRFREGFNEKHNGAEDERDKGPSRE